MKRLLLFFLLIATNAFAETPIFKLYSNIHKDYLDSPLYITDSKLDLHLMRIDHMNHDFMLAKVRVNFLDNDLKSVHTIIKNLSENDLKCLNDLDQFRCKLHSLNLPMTIKKSVCALKVSLLDNDDNFISNRVDLNWGECSPLILGKSDLAWEKDYKLKSLPLSSSPFPQEAKRILSANLSNRGTKATQRNFEVFAIGEDKKGDILWMGQIEFLDSMRSDSKREFSFFNAIAPWQYHRLCKLRLIADPHNRIEEESKINNETNLKFGLCEDAPDRDARPDIAPWIEYNNELLAVHIVNLSKVTITPPVTFFVEAWDSDGNLTDSFMMSFDETLYGYGEQGIYHWLVAKPETCKFRVSLDPKDHLRESERRNNVVELDNCQ